VGEVKAEIVLRSLMLNKASTAMLWIGHPAPKSSCALYLRAGERTDAVSFGENMEPHFDLGDAGKAHTYRVVIDREKRRAELS